MRAASLPRISSARTMPPTCWPLTPEESVQLRVYREVPETTVESLRAALDFNTTTNRRARSWQSFQEFQLSRSRLFAGRAGGLRAIGPEEHDFPTPFKQRPARSRYRRWPFPRSSGQP
jgi:hypothetical protein